MKCFLQEFNANPELLVKENGTDELLNVQISI